MTDAVRKRVLLPCYRVLHTSGCQMPHALMLGGREKNQYNPYSAASSSVGLN